MNIEKINGWFSLRGEWILKRRWLILVSFALLFAVGLSGLKYLNISSSWEDYFLEDDPMLVKTEEFKEIFGNDNYAAVLTRCDNIFTKENLELLRELSDEIMDSLSYAEKITSLTDIEFMVGNEEGMSIEQIVPDDIPSDPEGLAEIRRKAYMKPYISKRLVSNDGKSTWILLKLRPFPEDTVWNKGKHSVSPEMTTGNELEHVISKPKYQTLNPLGTGMPYATASKMNWINKEMPRIMGIAILLSIFVMLLVTRSLRGVVVPVITAIGSIVIVYGIMGYFRFKIDSGMMLVPMLLAFAVAVAYNIHIYSYFRRRFRLHGKRKQAVVETVGEMGWPVLFSALTTFAALLSFLAIPMVPMRFVGIATSSCVMLSFLIALTVMSSMLSFGKDRTPDPKVSRTGGGLLDKCLESFGSWVLRRWKSILIVSAIVIAFLIYEFTKIETAFDVERTMGRKVEYVNKLLEVGESELGSIYSYDMMIDLQEDGEAKNPEVLKKLDTLASIVSGYKMTKRTSSILDIIKDMDMTLHGGDYAFYKVPENSEEVAQLLLLYENAGGSETEYWIDYDYRRLRLMVEMNSYNSGEAEKELDMITKEAKILFPDAVVTNVGSIPQFTVAMQYITRGQMVSFVIALIIIGVLMMLVFGSVRIGLIGLIPNIIPAIVVGGLMGLLDYPLDMMTATIMPMILGLAVDDTIHFINHGHLEFSRQRNYKGAVLKTFRIVGTPIILTSIIISVNFAIYMTSQALSFRNMGFLSVAGMVSALLADLCITPILFSKFSIFGKEEKNK